MIHLANTILISTRSQLLVTLGQNTVKTGFLTAVLTLWIMVVYSRRPIAPYISSKREEEIHLVT